MKAFGCPSVSVPIDYLGPRKNIWTNEIKQQEDKQILEKKIQMTISQGKEIKVPTHLVNEKK